MRLIQGDCITEMQKLINDEVKIDLILTDPPYGTVKGLTIDGWKKNKTYWDTQLPSDEIFPLCEKLLRMNGRLILFSQEPYTNHLRGYDQENLPFLYPLLWRKDNFANYLGCKKAPVSYFEDISVFGKKYDTDNTHPLREYALNILEQIGLPYREIERRLGHMKANHFFHCAKSTQFALCTPSTYNELIEKFHIDRLDGYKTYEELTKINNKYLSVFNLPPNSKYKGNILEYKKPNKTVHPTQKPVHLLEDLIKTYTNKGDLVLDFTMGGAVLVLRV